MGSFAEEWLAGSCLTNGPLASLNTVRHVQDNYWYYVLCHICLPLQARLQPVDATVFAVE